MALSLDQYNTYSKVNFSSFLSSFPRSINYLSINNNIYIQVFKKSPKPNFDDLNYKYYLIGKPTQGKYSIFIISNIIQRN